MAWVRESYEQLGYIDDISGGWSATTMLIWERYSVIEFAVRATQEVTVSLSAPDNYTAGTALAYICPEYPYPEDSIPTNAIYLAAYDANRSVTFTMQGGSIYYVWLGPWDANQGEVYITLSISASGGSGGTDPWFTANKIGTDGIRVIINDPDEVITDKLCRIYLNGIREADIDLRYDMSCDIEGLPDGTYSVTVLYKVSGEWYDLRNQDDLLQTDIVIGRVTPYYTATGNAGALSIDIGVTDFGDITFSTFTYYIQSLTSSYSDSYSNSYGMHTFSGLSSEVYEVWVTYTYQGQEYDIPNSSGGSTYVTEIDLSGGGGGSEWSYIQYSVISDLSDTTRLSIPVTDRDGRYVSVSFLNSKNVLFRIQTGAGAEIFVTNGNYGYDPSDGRPYNSVGGKEVGATSKSFHADAGVYYTVWIKRTLVPFSGDVILTIMPASWSDQDINPVINPSGTTSRSWNSDSGVVYMTAVTFSESGTARFYSDVSGALSHPVLAWLMQENNGIDPESGEPLGTALAYDITGGDDFDFTYNGIVAGRTYYFWVRAARYDDEFRISEYFVPPHAPSSGGYVYIFANNRWTRAKPYIFSNGVWSPATAYIYSNSRWTPTL